MQPVTSAQTQPAPARDPDLSISQRMGGIAFACLLAALVVAVIATAVKGKKK